MATTQQMTHAEAVAVIDRLVAAKKVTVRQTKVNHTRGEQSKVFFNFKDGWVAKVRETDPDFPDFEAAMAMLKAIRPIGYGRQRAMTWQKTLADGQDWRRSAKEEHRTTLEISGAVDIALFSIDEHYTAKQVVDLIDDGEADVDLWSRTVMHDGRVIALFKRHETEVEIAIAGQCGDRIRGTKGK